MSCCGNVKLVFSPLTGEFQFITICPQPYASGLANFGDEVTSDLATDCGARDNDTSILDFGDRLIITESV